MWISRHSKSITPIMNPQYMLIVKELSQGLDYELGPRGNLGDTCMEDYYNNRL